MANSHRNTFSGIQLGRWDDFMYYPLYQRRANAESAYAHGLESGMVASLRVNASYVKVGASPFYPDYANLREIRQALGRGRSGIDDR